MRRPISLGSAVSISKGSDANTIIRGKDIGLKKQKKISVSASGSDIPRRAWRQLNPNKISVVGT
jgi:hypothetical protein